MRIDITEEEAAAIVQTMDPDLRATETLIAKIVKARRDEDTVVVGAADVGKIDPTFVLGPGTRVEITGNISPKYALGMRGECMSFPSMTKHRRVKVKIDPTERDYHRLGRFLHEDGTISFPGNCLKVVGTTHEWKEATEAEARAERS